MSKYNVSIRCQTHPDYSAKRRPSAQCLTCWTMWFHHRPADEPVLAGDLAKVLALLGNAVERIDNELAEKTDVIPVQI